MSICWYCHWGWPKEVADIYRRGVEQSGEMEMGYGPAHVVWADENFDNDTIRHCIADALVYEGEISDKDINVIITSLVDLLCVPEHIRLCEPHDYDLEHPELYPHQ